MLKPTNTVMVKMFGEGVLTTITDGSTGVIRLRLHILYHQRKWAGYARLRPDLVNLLCQFCAVKDLQWWNKTFAI